MEDGGRQEAEKAPAGAAGRIQINAAGAGVKSEELWETEEAGAVVSGDDSGMGLPVAQHLAGQAQQAQVEDISPAAGAFAKANGTPKSNKLQRMANATFMLIKLHR